MQCSCVQEQRIILLPVICLLREGVRVMEGEGGVGVMEGERAMEGGVMEGGGPMEPTHLGSSSPMSIHVCRTMFVGSCLQSWAVVFIHGQSSLWVVTFVCDWSCCWCGVVGCCWCGGCGSLGPFVSLCCPATGVSWAC